MVTEELKRKIFKIANIVATEACKKYLRTKLIDDVAQEVALDLLKRLGSNGTKMPPTKWSGLSALRRVVGAKIARGVTYWGYLPEEILDDGTWVKRGTISPVSADAHIAVTRLQKMLPTMSAYDRRVLSDCVDGKKQGVVRQTRALELLALIDGREHKDISRACMTCGAEMKISAFGVNINKKSYRRCPACRGAFENRRIARSI